MFSPFLIFSLMILRASVISTSISPAICFPILSSASDGSLDQAKSALRYLTTKWNEIISVINGERAETTSTIQ